MKLSVIVPVYNVENYLKQCLNSILSQSFKDFELICIDDCSTDNSYEILKEYANLDKRIIILKNEKNLGLGLTRNRGVKVAKGEYIHFVDSDDWLIEGAYEKLINKLNFLNFEPDILFFRHMTFCNISKKYTELKFKNEKILDKKLCPSKQLEAFDNWDRYAWLKWHKKEFLEKNNILYNDYPTMEDLEQAALVYTKAETLCYADIPVIVYRIERKDSLVHKANKKENLIYKIKSFEHNRILYENLDEKIKYTLLGFDYFQIKNGLEDSYLNLNLSLFNLFIYLSKVKIKDIDKYIYNRGLNYDKTLRINIPKIIFKKHFSTLFYLIVKIKKNIKK